MKLILKISLVLTSICLVCAFLLALVYNAAIPRIEANQKQFIQNSIRQLAPEATRQKEISINRTRAWELYEKDSLIGYAAIATGQGYGGQIKIMAVFNPELTQINGIKIIEDSETPGLGSRIRESEFRGQFEKIKVENLTQVETITGATISSKAAIKIVEEEASRLRQKLK